MCTRYGGIGLNLAYRSRLMRRFLIGLTVSLTLLGTGSLFAQETAPSNQALRLFSFLNLENSTGISFDPAAKSLSVRNVSIDSQCPSESRTIAGALRHQNPSCIFNVEVRLISF